MLFYWRWRFCVSGRLILKITNNLSTANDIPRKACSDNIPCVAAYVLCIRQQCVCFSKIYYSGFFHMTELVLPRGLDVSDKICSD